VLPFPKNPKATWRVRGKLPLPSPYPPHQVALWILIIILSPLPQNMRQLGGGVGAWIIGKGREGLLFFPFREEEGGKGILVLQ